MVAYWQGISSLLIWLVILLLFYGLPFVLSQVLVWTAAIRWRSIGVLLGPGPALSALIFILITSLVAKVSQPLDDLIKAAVFPLPWHYHVSSTAGMLVMFVFLVVLQLVLAALSFHLAYAVPRSYFSFSKPQFPGDEKLFSVSSQLMYGVVGAVLLLVVAAMVAVTTAGMSPATSEAAVVSFVFGLCLLGWLFMLAAPLHWVRGLVFAAALLTLSLVSLDMARHVGRLGVPVWGQLVEGTLFHRLVEVIPLGLLCMAYFWRVRFGQWMFKTMRLLPLLIIVLGTGLLTVVVLYAEFLTFLFTGSEARRLGLTGTLFVLVMGPALATVIQIIASRQPIARPEPTINSSGVAIPPRPLHYAVPAVCFLLAVGLWPRFSLWLLLPIFFLAASAIYMVAGHAGNAMADRIFTVPNLQSMLRPSSLREDRLLKSLWAVVIITALSFSIYVVCLIVL